MGMHDIGDIEQPQPSAVILGDSLARQYASALDETFKAHSLKIHTVFHDGCFFSPGYSRIRAGQLMTVCTQRLEQAIEYLTKHPQVPLIISMNWAIYSESISTDDGQEVDFDSMTEFAKFVETGILKILDRTGGRKIILIGLPPGLSARTGLSACLERPSYLPLNCLDRLDLDRKAAYGLEFNNHLRMLANRHPTILFLDPHDALCSDDKCHALENGEFVYSDSLHLSKKGAQIVINYFKRALTEL